MGIAALGAGIAVLTGLGAGLQRPLHVSRSRPGGSAGICFLAAQWQKVPRSLDC